MNRLEMAAAVRLALSSELASPPVLHVHQPMSADWVGRTTRYAGESSKGQ